MYYKVSKNEEKSNPKRKIEKYFDATNDESVTVFIESRNAVDT